MFRSLLQLETVLINAKNNMFQRLSDTTEPTQDGKFAQTIENDYQRQSNLIFCLESELCPMNIKQASADELERLGLAIPAQDGVFEIGLFEFGF